MMDLVGSSEEVFDVDNKNCLNSAVLVLNISFLAQVYTTFKKLQQRFFFKSTIWPTLQQQEDTMWHHLVHQEIINWDLPFV